MAEDEAETNAMISEGIARRARQLPAGDIGDALALRRLTERRDSSPWSNETRRRRSPVSGIVEDRQRGDAPENAEYWRHKYFTMARNRDTRRNERDTAREQRDIALARLEIVNESLQHLRDSIELLQGHSRRLGDDLRTTGSVGFVGGVEATPPRTQASSSVTLTPAASVSDGQDFPETG